MKNTSSNRRGRARSGGKRSQGPRNRNYQSGGGGDKVRGSAQQVLDKYMAMARDAATVGDRIAAEGFYQHAEHYYRVLNADRPDQPKKPHNDSNQNTGHKADDNRSEKAEEAPKESTESPKPARRRRPSKADDTVVSEAGDDVSDKVQTVEAPVSGGDDEAAA